MGCSASVSSRSPHGNKVVPDDRVAPRTASRKESEELLASVGKVPLPPQLPTRYGLCSSSGPAVSPRPRSQKQAKLAAKEEELKPPSKATSETTTDEAGRLEAESKAAAAAARTSDQDDPLAATRLGVTLRGLRKMYDTLLGVYGDELKNMSTEDVCRRWVVAVTKERRCRLLEVPGIVDGGDVAPPVYYISHVWRARFVSLLDFVLQHHLLTAASGGTGGDGGNGGGGGMMATVWLDFLAVNQHDGTAARTQDLAAIPRIVAACSGGTLVAAVDVAGCNPATRAWCLYEWAQTLLTHGSDGLHFLLDPYERAALFSPLDVRKAGCKLDTDKANILAAASREYGSPEGFNAALRLQLLLQPLSYKSDLRRLSPPAANAEAEWDFGCVRRWLAEGPAGARALCIEGGPGEGKSTMAAALCGHGAGFGARGALSEDGGAGAAPPPPPIVVHHFVRFDDQRRMEPLHVVRSLAFQLAERLPHVRDHLLGQLDAAEVAQLPPDGAVAFGELLLGPLCRLDPDDELGGRQVIVVLDALDEADPPPRWYSPSPSPLAAAAVAAAADAASDANADPGPESGSATPASLTATPAQSPRVGSLKPLIFKRAITGSMGRPGLGPASAGGVAAAHSAALPVCGNKVFQLLSKHLKYLPPFVRFVLTTSPDAMGGRMRASLDACFKGVGDVSYISPRELRRQQPAQAASAGAAGVSGGALPLHAVVQGACTGGDAKAMKSPSSRSSAAAAAAGALTRQYPNSSEALRDLHATYTRLFETRMTKYGKAERDAVQALLDVLVAAREPLPLAFLDGMGLAAVLSLLPGHPTTFFVDEARRARIFHASLIDWLTNPRVSGPFAADAARGHTRIAQHLLLRLQSPPPAMAPGTGQAYGKSSTSPYSLQYLVGHLAAAVVAAGGGSGGAAAVALSSSNSSRRLMAAAGGAAAAAALEGILQRYGFLAEVLNRGLGPTLTRDLARAAASPAAPSLAADVLRWLRSQRHRLVGIMTAEDVLGNALQSCPVGTRAYDAAQRACMSEAAAAGRPKWRLKHGLGLPRSWPALKEDLEGHTNSVTSVAWSPDGATIASASSDQTVRLWEAASGSCLAVLEAPASEGHLSDLQCVTWSPDGGTLARGGNDGAVWLWDAVSGECRAKLKPPPTPAGEAEVRSVAWSPRGDTLAVGNHAGEVALWDPQTCACTATLEGHLDAVHSVAWDPRVPGRLASAGEDGAVRLWEVLGTAGGRCIVALEGHIGCVRCVAWGPDGGALASGGEDNSVRLWGPAGGACACTATLEGHTWPVTSVAWSPDGATVASASADQTVRLWDVVTGSSLAVLEDFAYCVAWSPDGATLASGGSVDQTVRLYDVEMVISTAGITAPSEGPVGHSDIVNTVVWSPDGTTLASGSDDMTIRLWNAATGQCTATLQGPQLDRVFTVVFSPDGTLIASGSNDTAVRLWDLKTCACRATLQGHRASVFSLSWSPDGRLLASGSGDKGVRLWDVAEGRPPVAEAWRVLEGHADCVWCVAWSPDGRMLASGSNDMTVRVWSAGSLATPPLKLEGHAREVRSVTWSPDGRSLASGSIDMTVRLWDVARGQCTASLRGHCGCVFSVAWSPDGRMVASGGRDKSVRFWDAVTRENVAVLQGHPDDVNTVAWSPDGKALASGSDDESIRVFVLVGEGS